MKVSDLVEYLKLVNQEATINLRYMEEVTYSEYTIADESVLLELDAIAVINLGDMIVLAADLCDRI